MLIEFSVKNFLSFKNTVTLSMEKGSGDENKQNYFEVNNINLLKTAAIYGANASGKTNIIKALTCAILIVRNSNIISLGNKWNFIKPFVFNESSKKEPSEFEFIFITNNIKYKYRFTLDENKVYDESLDAYYSQKPTNIFTRKNTNEYLFNEDKKILESIKAKNTENKLFLSTATNWNYEKTKDAYLWFINSIDTYSNFNNISDEDLIEYGNKDGELKSFALKLLKEADILIKDINVNYEERYIDSSMFDLYLPSISKSSDKLKMKNIKIELFHEIIDDKNKTSLYKLNFEDESEGTKILFALAPFLKRSFENTKIIIVDELERSLHPSLVEFLIKTFNNKKLNKANSQLIFTTHATNLLDLSLFRRDQIWFMEKDANTGISDFYPLDSFSVRKGENIQKGYINGRYGAIPFIYGGDLWQEDNM